MPEAPPAFHALRLEELAIEVHLGCTSAERSRAQEAHITVEIRFPQAPRAVHTDSLPDTICYGRLAEAIRDKCERTEYQLIERLGYDVYGIARELGGPGVKIGISVRKLRPPVKNLLGGARFLCGDFAP